MMKRIILFLFLVVCTIGVANAQREPSSGIGASKREAMTAIKVADLIKQKEFTFIIERALPSYDRLTVAYDIRVEPNEVRCWLPGEDHFFSQDFTYKVESTDKRSTTLEIYIRETQDRKQYKIVFEIENNGQTQATVTRISASGRSRSYLGYIVARAED